MHLALLATPLASLASLSLPLGFLSEVTQQFLAFFIICMCGFAYIATTATLGALFGGGGDDGDPGDGSGAEDSSAEHSEDTVSIFSPRMIAIFLLAFGAGGCLSTHFGAGVIAANVWALSTGTAIGGVMLLGMRALYRQRASSDIHTIDSIGKLATVTTAIPGGGTGQVGVTVKGQYMTYHARAAEPFPRDSLVRITAAESSIVMVEHWDQSARNGTPRHPAPAEATAPNTPPKLPYSCGHLAV